MLNNLLPLLDLVFPPRPQTLLVRSCSIENVRAQYSPGSYAGVTYLSSYESRTIQALIQENKYFKNKTAARLLAGLLAQWLATHSSSRPLVVIPIPLGPSRQRERGYNQVMHVLQQLPQNSRCTIDDTVLSRSRDTASQTTLRKSERLKNIAGAFAIDSNRLTRYGDYHLIIIDDVVTTGATMTAARASLAPHLPKDSSITLLALAH